MLGGFPFYTRKTSLPTNTINIDKLKINYKFLYFMLGFKIYFSIFVPTKTITKNKQHEKHKQKRLPHNSKSWNISNNDL